MKIKFLQGGAFTPPFAVYQPFIVPYPEEKSTTTSKKSSGNDNDIKMKDIYGLLDGLKEAIPGDIAAVSSKLGVLFNNIESKLNSTESSLFGGTGSIASEYIQILNIVNNLKFQHKAFEDAKKISEDRKSLSEVVINSTGKIMVTDGDGFDWVTPEEYFKNKEDYSPITNALLLDFRAKGISGLAFNYSSLEAVAGSIGMEDITKMINDAISDLLSDSVKETGYAESKKLLQGLEDYLQAKEKSGNYDATVEDLYKGTLLTENLARSAKLALTYIYNSLPTNALTLLKMKSDGTIKGALLLVDSLVYSKTKTKNEFDLDLEGGPSAKSSGKTSESNNDKSNPYLQLIREEGGQPREFTIVQDGTNTGLSLTGTFYSALPNINEEMSIDAMLSTGLLHITNNSRKSISFGDQLLDPSQLKDVMFDNEGGAVMTLPIIKDQLGNIRVNLGIIEDFNTVQKEMKNYKNLPEQEYFKKYAELLKKYELDELIDFTTGLPDLSRTAQFLVIGAYTTDKIDINKNSKFIKKIDKPTEDLQNRLIKGLSTDKDKSNYSVDVDNHWGFFELFWDDVYKANVFIPLNQNPNAAINAQGDQRSENSVLQSELMYLNFNKLKNMKPTYEIE